MAIIKRQSKRCLMENKMEANITLSRIKNGDLTQQELATLVTECLDEWYDEENCGTQITHSVFVFDDRYYQIDWENNSWVEDYYKQPFEVRARKFKKIVTAKEWRKL